MRNWKQEEITGEEVGGGLGEKEEGSGAVERGQLGKDVRVSHGEEMEEIGAQLLRGS